MMSIVLALAVVLAGVLLLAGFIAIFRAANRREEAINAAWQQAGTTLDMAYTNGAFKDRRLDGTLDGHQIVVRVETVSTGQVTLQRTLLEIEGLPRTLTLRREGALDGVWDRLGAADQQLGAQDFDDAVRLGGDAVATLAYLDAETRSLVQEMVARGARLNKGKLTITRDEVIDDSNTIIWLAQKAVALAGRLTTGTGVGERLAHNALHDPVAGVRLANLRGLLRHGPEGPREATARAALDDSDPYVALEAGTWLGLDAGEAADQVAGAVSLSRLSAEQGALSEVRRQAPRQREEN